MATIPLTPTQISDFEANGILELPAGNFSVSTTIDLGTCNGALLSGAGQSYDIAETANDKQVTRLFCTGTAGEPMIKGQVRGLVVRDIQLLDARIWVEPKSGFGTGHCLFERTSFYGEDGGVLFGDVSFNGNAADSTFRDCQFNRCDPCVELTTSQNVNFTMERTMLFRCGPAFLVNGGGLINVDNCYLTKVPEVFRLTGDGTKTGSQNNKFSVTNLRYDNSQDVKPKVVVDTGSYGSRVLTVINTHEPTIGVDYVDVQGGASWTVKGLEISEVDIMSATPIQGQGTEFNVSLLSRANGEILLNPTIEAADFNISTDGGALTQLTNTPTVEPAGSGIVRFDLTAAEVGTAGFTVIMSDASGSEWKNMNYHETVADAADFKADVSSLSLEQTVTDGFTDVLSTGGAGPWTTGGGGGGGGATAPVVLTGDIITQQLSGEIEK